MKIFLKNLGCFLLSIFIGAILGGYLWTNRFFCHAFTPTASLAYRIDRFGTFFGSLRKVYTVLVHGITGGLIAGIIAYFIILTFGKKGFTFCLTLVTVVISYHLIFVRLPILEQTSFYENIWQGQDEILRRKIATKPDWLQQTANRKAVINSMIERGRFKLAMDFMTSYEFCNSGKKIFNYIPRFKWVTKSSTPFELTNLIIERSKDLDNCFKMRDIALNYLENLEEEENSWKKKSFER